jgi:hypothetical protein
MYLNEPAWPVMSGQPVSPPLLLNILRQFLSNWSSILHLEKKSNGQVSRPGHVADILAKSVIDELDSSEIACHHHIRRFDISVHKFVRVQTCQRRE